MCCRGWIKEVSAEEYSRLDIQMMKHVLWSGSLSGFITASILWAFLFMKNVEPNALLIVLVLVLIQLLMYAALCGLVCSIRPVHRISPTDLPA
jgi:hypothetical protein